MSKKLQTKNSILLEKLLEFLAKAPNKPDVSATYVVFSKDDKELNKINSNLVKGLIGEGKTVIKANETSDSKRPWSFKTI